MAFLLDTGPNSNSICHLESISSGLLPASKAAFEPCLQEPAPPFYGSRSVTLRENLKGVELRGIEPLTS